MRTIVAVTGVWDLHRNPARLRNYERFAEEVRAARVTLLTAELALDDDPHMLPRPAMQLRLPRRDAAPFQKEALMQRLVSSAGADADTVCWMDADVLLLNRDWPAHAVRELEYFHYAQLFSTTRYESGWHDLGPEVASAGARWSTRDQLFDDYTKSHPGLAWAARGETLRRHGLYCHMPTGGGDQVIFRAMTGMARMRGERGMSAAFRGHAKLYADAVRTAGGQGSVGFVHGCAVHLHHGDLRERDYAARWDLPWYDPYEDATPEDGPLRWTERALAERGAEVAALGALGMGNPDRLRTAPGAV